VIPAGWDIASLGELSYAWSYGTSTKCDYGARGIPVVRIPNVAGGRIDTATDIKFAVDASLDLSDLFLTPGDLLFVRTNGSTDLIGRVGVVDEPVNAAFASYLIRFRLVPQGVLPDWVNIVVSSPLWRHHIISLAASSAGQFNLNSRALAAIPIPVPPGDEQRVIINLVNHARERSLNLGSVISQVANRASALREQVLELAFSGGLIKEVAA
jgi:type I restriction enzyme S subunit